MIRKAEVPVVPCVIDGAYDVWPRHKTLPRPFGKITVRYGDPMDLSDLPGPEIRRRIDEAFADLMAEARGER